MFIESSLLEIPKPCFPPRLVSYGTSVQKELNYKCSEFFCRPNVQNRFIAIDRVGDPSEAKYNEAKYNNKLIIFLRLTRSIFYTLKMNTMKDETVPGRKGSLR